MNNLGYNPHICKYCGKETKYGNYGYYYCRNHGNVWVAFYVSSENFYLYGYCPDENTEYELYVKPNLSAHLWLIKSKGEYLFKNNLLMSFRLSDYNDINLHNVTQWISRLKNLLVFS